MKIKKEKELFDLFVEKDGFRESLQTPFVDKTDGRVWASDGYILIMVNPKCISRKYDTRDMSKGKMNVCDYNCDHIVDVADMENAIDRLPKCPEVITKKTECPECHGTGYVYTTYTASSNGKWYDDLKTECPVCDGIGELDREETHTGRMVPKYDSSIKIGEGSFMFRKIETVIDACKKLGVTQIRLIRTCRKGMSVFALSDDVHIALNTMINPEGKEVKADAEVTITNM